MKAVVHLKSLTPIGVNNYSMFMATRLRLRTVSLFSDNALNLFMQLISPLQRKLKFEFS